MNHVFRGIAFAVLILLVLVVLVLLIPVFCYWHWTYRWRVRSVARRHRCRCGHTLGAGSVELANVLWAAEASERRRRAAPNRIRLTQDVHAICVVCGRRYRYRDRDSAFEVIPFGFGLTRPPFFDDEPV